MNVFEISASKTILFIMLMLQIGFIYIVIRTVTVIFLLKPLWPSSSLCSHFKLAQYQSPL